jgi:hypothetical protein
MRNTADMTDGKAIAVLLQSISGVSAIKPLVAFYDIHGGKREVLFFYFVPDTSRDYFEVGIYQKHSWVLAIFFQSFKGQKCPQKEDLSFLKHIFVANFVLSSLPS